MQGNPCTFASAFFVKISRGGRADFHDFIIIHEHRQLFRTMRTKEVTMKQATVATFLLLTAAGTAVMATAAAQTVWTPQTEMPGFLSQEDWCLMTPSPYSNNAEYKAVPGCKSFVVKLEHNHLAGQGVQNNKRFGTLS
jgi:hypothetical protein